MSNFNLSTLAGTGNGSVEVRTTAANTGYSDKTTVATVSNGLQSDSITIKQYGLPSINRAYAPQRVIPAAGEQVPYICATHYDICFVGIPSWITVKDGQGNTYTDGHSIAASVANGKTFIMVVAENTSTSQREVTGSVFYIEHWLRGTRIHNYRYGINITQAGAEAPQEYITVNGSPSFEWDDVGRSKTIMVSASSEWAYTASTTYFNYTKSSTALTVTARSANQSNANYSVTITFGLVNGSAATTTATARQYFKPQISAPSGQGTVIPFEGGSKTIYVRSPYDWWYGPLPLADYVTIKDIYNVTYDNGPSNPRQGTGNLETFTHTWSENSGNTSRSTNYYLYYRNLDSETKALSGTQLSFMQQYEIPSVHTITGTDAIFPSTGGSATVKVISTDSWYWTDRPSYINITDSNGNNANYTSSSRRTGTGVEETYTLTWSNWSSPSSSARTWTAGFSYNGGSQTGPTYTQYAVNGSSVVANSPLSISYKGTGATITVNSFNPWWWGAIPDYVTITDQNGNPADYTSTNKAGIVVNAVFNATFTRNSGSTERSYTPKIRYTQGGNTYTATSPDSITQRVPYLVEPNDFVVAADDTSIKDIQHIIADAAPANSWSYSFDPSITSLWFKINDYHTTEDESVMKVYCMENTGGVRKSVMTITSPDGQHTFPVNMVQLSSSAYPTNQYIYVNPTSFSHSANETTVKEIEVSALNSWTATRSQTWIVNDGGWAGNSASTSTLRFHTTANQTGYARSGSIYITDSQSHSRTITITQEANVEAPSITAPSSVDATQSAGNTIAVTANCTWTATTTDSWITITTSTGSGNGNVVYSVATNSGNLRRGIITLTGPEGAGAEVEVFQTGAGLNVWADPSVINTHRYTAGSTTEKYFTVRFVNKSGSMVLLDTDNADVLYFQGGWESESLGTGTTNKRIYALVQYPYDWTGHIKVDNTTLLTVNCNSSTPE